MCEEPMLEGRSSIALAAVVLTVSVAVTVPLAGGVTEAPGLLNAQVGPLETTGATAQARVTAELKPFTEPTVIVDVAETPAAPDVGDNAPLAMVKPAAVPWVYFATNASVPPPLAACFGATVGKSVEV